MAADEKLAIVSAINSYSPRTILFVGGETTLYIKTINEILSGVRAPLRSRIKITTNGHFAKTVGAAVSVLKSFKKLDKVQLSYDRFHAEFLPFEGVRNLYHACKSLGIEFCVLNTISSPLELVGIPKFGQIGKFKVLVNKVLRVGEAARNGIEYLYPSFDRGVLKRRCPGLGSLAYICGRGFSVCCSSLSFETNLPVAHGSISQHKRSRFYRLISGLTLGQLLKKTGRPSKGLTPQFSAECNLCMHIFGGGKLLA